MEKISIIVPIYNVMKYIDMCIESIINQTYKNIEIILIDDGSTDESANICDAYAQKDKRVLVIHKKNEGVSIARNTGIKISTGKFIMFVDGDDYLPNNTVEIMMKNIENNQMVICGYIEKYLNLDKKHIITEKNKVINYKEAINLLFDRKYYGGYLWNKIFIAQIIKENDLTFQKDIHMCEDLVFVCEYMTKCKEIKLIKDLLYYYRMRKSSMVWSSSNNKFYSLFRAYDILYRMIKDKNISTLNIEYMMLFDIYTHHKFVKDNNIKFLFNYNSMYYKMFFKKEISLIRKIKLFVIRRFKFIYKIYLKRKISQLKQFE